MASAQRLRLGRSALVLWILAAAISAAVLFLAPQAPFQWGPALMLLLAALVAEVRPVHFRREGVMLCLSLPFVAGLLLVAGPVAAVAGELLLMLVASLWRAFDPAEKRVWFWARVNLPIGAVSAATGAMAFTAFASQPLVAVGGYITAYLLVNGLLVSRLNSLRGTRSFAEEVRHNLPATAVTLAAYLIVGIGVAILLQSGLWGLVPALLLPVLLLRHVVQRQTESEEMAYETMVALTIMLQRAHPYTHGHLERVGRIAEEVGLRLGIPRHKAPLLRAAAVLHDIGKIAIDEEVLDKPSRLTEQEYEHVKQHSEFGSRILLDSPRFATLAPWILYHHERPDGRGYPHQLTDVEIPLESKIIAVADAFDAMAGGTESSERRNYRPNMTPGQAIEELERCSGSQFDPRVVGAFREVLTEQGVLVS